MDERVWLRHKDHGGTWHAPAGAAEAFADMGWEPGEPAEEFNPVVAENLAAQRRILEAGEAVIPLDTKPGRDSGTDTTSQEK